MELWLHVHRIYWIHVAYGVFSNLDFCNIYYRPIGCMDLAYKYIQKEGNERNIRSLSSLVANVKGAPEAKMAAICSVAFLLIYAGAQLSSGGKALFAMLGWAEWVGIIIGFVLVVAYCYAGGIRASIWTDAAQSCVMIVVQHCSVTLLCLKLDGSQDFIHH